MQKCSFLDPILAKLRFIEQIRARERQRDITLCKKYSPLFLIGKTVFSQKNPRLRTTPEIKSITNCKLDNFKICLGNSCIATFPHFCKTASLRTNPRDIRPCWVTAQIFFYGLLCKFSTAGAISRDFMLISMISCPHLLLHQKGVWNCQKRSLHWS